MFPYESTAGAATISEPGCGWNDHITLPVSEWRAYSVPRFVAMYSISPYSTGEEGISPSTGRTHWMTPELWSSAYTTPAVVLPLTPTYRKPLDPMAIVDRMYPDNDMSHFLAPAAVTPYTCPLEFPTYTVPLLSITGDAYTNASCVLAPIRNRHEAPEAGKKSLPGAYGELPWRFEEPRHVGQGEPVMYAAWFRPRRSIETNREK